MLLLKMKDRLLAERMKALDPEQNEGYKFLGCEHEQINTDAVYERVKSEMYKIIKAFTSKTL